jgi:hypothetical protein
VQPASTGAKISSLNSVASTLPGADEFSNSQSPLNYDSMTTTLQRVQGLDSINEQPNTQQVMEGSQSDHGHPESCVPNSPDYTYATTPRPSPPQFPEGPCMPSFGYTQDTSPSCPSQPDSAGSSGPTELQNGALYLENRSGSNDMGSVGTISPSSSDKPLSQHPMMLSDMKKEPEPTELVALDTDTRSISPPGSALDAYMSSYWQYFDPLWPIIHRATFDPTKDSLLSSAMAAIGTQYHSTQDARSWGYELNEACKKEIELVRMLSTQCTPTTNDSAVPKLESAYNASDISH